MKRLAAIFIVAAAVSGATPVAAGAAGADHCHNGGAWPLSLFDVPYC